MNFSGFLKKKVISWIIVVLFVSLVLIFLKDILKALKYTINLFLPFIIAYIVSLLVNPLADKLQRKFRLPRGWTAVILIVLVVGIVGGILFWGIWKLIMEIKDIYISIPNFYENGMEYFKNIYFSLPNGVRLIIDSVMNNIEGDVSEFLKRSYPRVMTFTKNFAMGLPRIFFITSVFIIALYFMISGSEKIDKRIKGMIPKCMKNPCKKSGIQIKKYFGGYLKAQFILMMVAFGILLVGFLVLKIKYSLLLALGIALFDALPFFGTVMILIPWSLIGFLNGNLTIGIGMIVIYIVLVAVREIIEPKIVSTNIGISPLLTLVSMYVGFKVFSIGGMILGPFALMLFVSLYKAEVFDGTIKLLKTALGFIICESKKIIKNITIR